MRRLLTFLLLALGAAHAQLQSLPVVVYGFANTTNFTTADAAFVDGALIPAIQSQVDSGVSCSIGPPATCNIPGGYSWTTPNGYVTTWQGQTCAGTLRASADSACSIGIGMKSIANLSPNSWASNYVFTQAFANYACDRKPFVASGTYYLGQCFKASGEYFQVTGAGTTAQCSAGTSTPPALATSTGTCSISDGGSSHAPLQNVAVDNGYGLASLPVWGSGNVYPTGSVIINQTGGNGLVYTAQAPGGTSGATQPTCGNNTTCSDGAGGVTWKATQHAVLNLGTAPTVDTLAIVSGLFPVTWETPFSYSQDAYYSAGISNYQSTSGIRFVRGGFGTGEEQSTHALDAMQHDLPYGTLTDLQMETLWTGRVQSGATNEANTWLASPPAWKLELLSNAMTGLSSNGGTDWGPANVEVRTMLSLLPAFGGYGSNGLETGDLIDMADGSPCTLGLTQCYSNTYPNGCTNNWCAQFSFTFGQVPIISKQEFNISNAAFPATCSGGGCPEVICSSTDTATNCGGVATQSNPDLELQQVLVVSTTHGATQIELSRNEFDCAFGTPPVGSYCAGHPSTVTAYATALKNAALGLPSVVSAAGGTGHGGGTGHFQ